MKKIILSKNPRVFFLDTQLIKELDLIVKNGAIKKQTKQSPLNTSPNSTNDLGPIEDGLDPQDCGWASEFRI